MLCAFAVTSIDPRFAIIVSGFRSGSLAHANYYEEIITMPSMHMYGASDQVIPMDMSKSLAEIFETPTSCQHNGGHYFATAVVPRNIYIEFIRQQLINYLEQKELERADAVIAEAAASSIGELRVSSSDSDWLFQLKICGTWEVTNLRKEFGALQLLWDYDICNWRR